MASLYDLLDKEMDLIDEYQRLDFQLNVCDRLYEGYDEELRIVERKLEKINKKIKKALKKELEKR